MRVYPCASCGTWYEATGGMPICPAGHKREAEPIPVELALLQELVSINQQLQAQGKYKGGGF